MFSVTARFLSGLSGFFIISVCLLVDKNKAVVCCLIAKSATAFSEMKKRKRKCGVRSSI
jgi:hypothetical protein